MHCNDRHQRHEDDWQCCWSKWTDQIWLNLHSSPVPNYNPCIHLSQTFFPLFFCLDQRTIFIDNITRCFRDQSDLIWSSLLANYILLHSWVFFGGCIDDWFRLNNYFYRGLHCLFWTRLISRCFCILGLFLALQILTSKRSFGAPRLSGFWINNNLGHSVQPVCHVFGSTTIRVIRCNLSVTFLDQQQSGSFGAPCPSRFWINNNAFKKSLISTAVGSDPLRAECLRRKAGREIFTTSELVIAQRSILYKIMQCRWQIWWKWMFCL